MSADQPPPFRTETTLVTVDVVIVDERGLPLVGLTADDFQLLDEGTPQRIGFFQPASTAAAASDSGARARPHVSYATNVGTTASASRVFVLLFDDLHLTREQGQRARQALVQFIESSLSDDDLVSLVVPGSGLRWHARLPQGRDELLQIAERLEGRLQPEPTFERITDFEAYRIHVFQDEAVAEQVDRRWRSFRALGREPTNLATDRGFRPQDRGSTVGVIRQDIAIRAADAYSRVMARNRVTLGALRNTVEALEAVRGRKSVLLLSAGLIEDQEQVDARRVLEAATRANVAMYFIDARGLDAGSVFGTAQFGSPLDSRDIGAAAAQLELEVQGSENLAVDSGGYSVRNTNDLPAALTRISQEMSSYYLLGFQPTSSAAPGTYRRLQVRVGRAGVRVRARKGYIVGADLPAAPRAAALGADALQRATESPYDLDAVPLRVSSYVFGEVAPERALVNIALEADLRAFGFATSGERMADVLELRVAATHLETSATERYDEALEMTFPAGTTFGEDAWHGMVREFRLSPGRYQARVAVRDRNTGRVGTVTHTFDVPPVDGFRLTTPIVTDTVQVPPDGPPVPVLVVRRTFPAGTTLYYQFTVLGASGGGDAAQVSAGHEVRARTGEVVRLLEPRPIAAGPGGVLRRLSGINLRDVPPGEYHLVLRVTDQRSGRTIEMREPFVLLPPPV